MPLAQFVMDWNRSTDRGGLIADAPVHADDGNVLPAIAVVAHALAVRDRERVPDWMHDHRAEGDVALFGHALDTPLRTMGSRQRTPRMRISQGIFPCWILGQGHR